jgi:tetratricopeptide (TPR) repeat protein
MWFDYLKEIIAFIAGLGLFGLAARWIYRRWLIWRTPPAKGTHFTILVAQLAGDDGNNGQQSHIRQSLEAQFRDAGAGADARMHIVIYPETLRLRTGKIGAAVAEAEKKGRAWLEQRNADILIWGEVADANRLLRLRFTTASSNSEAAKGYALTETLELPAGFGADFGAVLAAQAASGIRPVYDKPGHALADIIAPIVEKLRPLAEDPPASFSGGAKGSLWHAYAAGQKQLGEEKGDSARLMTAIAYYRKTLSAWPRERVPLDWAMTQNNLGTALQTLGERESGTARLEEAVAAFGAALGEWTRERVPLQWAMTQNNLGTALMRLAERESGTARLEEAVEAYRAALGEFTRERVPLQWATTQNNLGNALASLGERESGTALLEEAVAAYRAALGEWTRERVPLQWAMTQNNLGNALRVLGERRAASDPALARRTLTEAREALAGALEVFQEAKASYYVEVTERNLARIDAAIAALPGKAAE